MKQASESYISFTRTERYGLAALCILVILLIMVRLFLPYWVHPAISTNEEQKMVAAWEVYKRSQSKAPEKAVMAGDTYDYIDASDDNPSSMPAVVNINTADSATLVRLKGIGPVLAHKIIMYRAVKGDFADVNGLLDLQTIPPATFNILKKHLSVKWKSSSGLNARVINECIKQNLLKSYYHIDFSVVVWLFPKNCCKLAFLFYKYGFQLY